MSLYLSTTQADQRWTTVALLPRNFAYGCQSLILCIWHAQKSSNGNLSCPVSQFMQSLGFAET